VRFVQPFITEGAVSNVVSALRTGWIGQGSRVGEFEAAFCRQLGVPPTVATSSCAGAVRLALAIAGVGPGDEVITTPLTWQSTNHPILEQFARPVFADVQVTTGNLDPADLERRITSRTKAILCTHWGGYPADLDELHEIATRHGLTLIEEAAEALGSTYKGRPIGGISRFTAFSLYAFQTLTTGEGGMLTVSKQEDFEAARRRRWFGIDRSRRTPAANGYYDYDTFEPGYAYEMTDLTASIGLAQLEVFDSLVAARRRFARRYREALSGIAGVELFACSNDRNSACGLFTMRVAERERFWAAMRGRGVEVSVVHVRNDQYTVFGGRRRDLPQLDELEPEYVCLPVHNHLTIDDVEYVIESVRRGW
jgi:perosamine synthetase